MDKEFTDKEDAGLKFWQEN